jgi:hypothetical protein
MQTIESTKERKIAGKINNERGRAEEKEHHAQ